MTDKKNADNENMGDNKFNKKSLLKKLKTYIFLYIAVMFLFVYPISYIDIFLTPPINRFSFQIANYATTYKFLSYFNTLKLGNTPMAYGLRYMLFKQYKHIVKTGKPNVYNNIGTFYDIHKDFIILTKSYNNKNSNLYIKYKQKYLAETEKILINYKEWNITTNHFLSDYRYGRYNIQEEIIPNRITFYIELAQSLYENGNFPYIQSIENLNKLKEILLGFDTIIEQEKNSEKSYNIDKFSQKRNLTRYNHLYPIFISNYSKGIIPLELDVYPDTFCENVNIFDKYYSIQDIYPSMYINNLIETKCKYKKPNLNS